LLPRLRRFASHLDEARLAARIRHPNVTSVLDVVALEKQLFLVMDYVQGESLSHLIKLVRQKGQKIPPRIVSAIMVGVLMGLHAAHEARGGSRDGGQHRPPRRVAAERARASPA
jgi:serine/threonine protein kinase